MFLTPVEIVIGSGYHHNSRFGRLPQRSGKWDYLLKKKSLKALYETWGIDKVSKDLEHHYYPSLLSSDVSAFERAWVNAKEAEGGRRKQFAVAFNFFFSLLAGTIAAFVTF